MSPTGIEGGSGFGFIGVLCGALRWGNALDSADVGDAGEGEGGDGDGIGLVATEAVGGRAIDTV